MLQLVIQSGKRKGKRLVLSEKPVVVGRDETCQIRLASSDISRQHCTLHNTADGIVVTDLGSRNNTLVNDIPIEKETVLASGDILRIGPLVFRVIDPALDDTVETGEQDLQAESIPPKQADGNLSDDDIANWLSEDGSGSPSSGDTAVIPKYETTTAASESADDPASPQAAKQKPKKKFKSISEEATDIIRRHWQAVGEEQAD